MKYRIGDLCTYMGSGGTPSRKNKEYYQNGHIKWLKTKELNDGNIYNTEEHITSKALSKSSAKLFPINTITMAMYGATVGKLGVMKTECATNQACCNMVANDKKIDYRFLYYSLLINRDKLINLANGAAQQNLNKGIIENFEIDYYEINEQKAIAHILSTLDDEIEVNNQINKTLENMAQAIFKQWFVDFEFPNEDGEPYKSSGGEMIESELGMIPKGWEVGTLNDISLDIITGKTPSTKDKNNFNGNIPFVKIPDMHDKVFVTKTESYLSDKGAVKNKIIPPNSIIVSCIATPGLVSLASEECQTNQQINTIINKYEKMYYYTYFLLTSLSEHIRTLGSTGSTTLNLNKGQFSKIKVLIPLRKVTKNYHDLVDPLFKEILTNAALDEELTQIRDSLLPKLMSGEIRVPLDEEGDVS